MELRHLRYFVAVAEERNFTRAAAKLGIKQPPLSSQIRQLERELGAQLVRRLTRGIELTESGAVLLDRAKWILLCVDQTRVDVQRQARGEAGRINLGFAGATHFHPTIPQIVVAYHKRYPDVVLSPVQSDTPTLLGKLRSGEIDLAFIRPPFVETKGIDSEFLVAEPMVIVLPASHRLAGSRSVTLASLAEESFILPTRNIAPGLYDAVIASFGRAGFSPKLGKEAGQIVALVPMVRTGFGISIVPRSVSAIRFDEVVYVPIRGDAPKAAISLAYRHDEHSAAVRNFVALARRQR